MAIGIAARPITTVLEKLYADAAANDPAVHQAAKDAGVTHANEAEFFRAVRRAYMPVGREFGALLYAMGRTCGAKTIVEFGTSFGISTIYLAAAARDNGYGKGNGKVITTEYEAEKVERAKQNLTEAGLIDWVEFRVGDALQSLKVDVPTVDLVLLDGAKSMYFDVLKILEPSLRSGAIIASDNTDNEAMLPFLNYVRSADNGYASSAINTSNGRRNGAHEITVRL